MQETWFQSLGREDPLEEETATSILAWKIPQTEELGRLPSVGSLCDVVIVGSQSDVDLATKQQMERRFFYL